METLLCGQREIETLFLAPFPPHHGACCISRLAAPARLATQERTSSWAVGFALSSRGP